MRVVQDDMREVVEQMKRDSLFNASLIEAIGNTHLEVDEFPLFYMYGTEVELNNRLKERGTDRVLKYRKYPLVALRLPAPRTVNGNITTYSPGLNLAIMTHTDRNLNAEQRTEQVFKPILYPLLKIFFRALRDSGKFTWSGRIIPPHDEIDRMYWGVEAGGKQEANIFSDPIDAIEIMNLQISSYFKC